MTWDTTHERDGGRAEGRRRGKGIKRVVEGALVVACLVGEGGAVNIILLHLLELASHWCCSGAKGHDSLLAARHGNAAIATLPSPHPPTPRSVPDL